MRVQCRWLKLHFACCCWSGVIHMCLFVFFRGSPPLMMRSWRFFCPSSRFWVLCVSFEASAPTITSPLGSFWTPRGKQTTLCCSTPSSASSSRGICGCVVILVSTKVSDFDEWNGVCVHEMGWTSKSNKPGCKDILRFHWLEQKTWVDFLWHHLPVSGEHCEEHVAYFKQVFGENALMKQATAWKTTVAAGTMVYPGNENRMKLTWTLERV